jgi:hypothetical protein
VRHYADRPAALADAALAYALADSDDDSQRGWWRLEKAALRWAEWTLRARVLQLEMELSALKASNIRQSPAQG